MLERHLIFMSLFVGVAACSGSEISFATSPGDSVVVPGVTDLTFTSRGGGLESAFPPPGVACDAGVWTYSVYLDTQTFSWSTCDVANQGLDAADYTVNEGSRSLSTTELATAEAAFRNVHVAAKTNGCGADKPTWEVSVGVPSNMLTYGDSFYTCLRLYDHFVESEDLWPLESVLAALAHD